MKSDYESATIINDSDDEEIIIIQKKIVKPRIKQQPLNKFYIEDADIFEIGVDEVGRGPLFGRVYTAAVILPKDDSFNHSMMKDSKKFHSKSKIVEVSNYIKQNAIAWYVSFEDEKIIDEINILQATQQSMHKSILEVRKQFIQQNKLKNSEKNSEKPDYNINLLIDGNYFNPITTINKKTNKLETIPYMCIEGGDNTFSAIAAASILAKVARDEYIVELCTTHPLLDEHYGLLKNKGYGTKKHMDGIKAHGISEFHRKSFGICREYA